jgi:hypothetical protein
MLSAPCPLLAPQVLHHEAAQAGPQVPQNHVPRQGEGWSCTQTAHQRPEPLAKGPVWCIAAPRATSPWLRSHAAQCVESIACIRPYTAHHKYELSRAALTVSRRPTNTTATTALTVPWPQTCAAAWIRAAVRTSLIRPVLRLPLQVTQCLGCLGDKPWYMAVARPSGSVAAYPRQQDLTAFEVPPGVFIKMEMGTWHAGEQGQHVGPSWHKECVLHTCAPGCLRRTSRPVC